VTTDGRYYLVEFNEKVGGDCKLIEKIDFFEMIIRVRDK
jgi:hypothetical protein